MQRIVVILISALALSACGQGRTNFHSFDGQSFTARAKGETRWSKEFAVSVRGASKSLEGARQAGAYQAVQYCIDRYGTSDIIWTNGPDAEESALIIEGDALILNGTCVE